MSSSSSSDSKLSSSSALIEGQKNLKNEKESFVEKTDSEVESESEEEVPKKKTPILNPTRELVNQLVLHHKIYTKTQKKIHRIQSELSREEVINRYTKLDLNNAQLRIDELRKKIIDYKTNFQHSHMENVVSRIILVIYIAYLMYGYISRMDLLK